jgi:hypothetical protein
MAQPNTPVTAVVITIVLVGIGAALLAGIGSGFDVTAIIILVLIGLAGWLGVSVARRSNTERVMPRECPNCGWLNATAALRCNRCGTDLSVERPGV